MKRSLEVSCALVAFAAALAGAQGRVSVVTPGIAPFSWEDGDGVTGIGADLTEEVFRRIGIPVEITVMPPARSLAMAQSGEFDAIFPLAKTAEREAFLAYPAEPFIDQPVSVFTLRDSPVAYDGSAASLTGRSIGMIMGGKYSAELTQAFKDGTLKAPYEVAEYGQLVKLLVLSRVDAIIGPRSSILYAVKQERVAGRINELSPPVVASSPAYLAVVKKGKATGLVDEIDAALRAMKKDGTYDRIVKGYLE